MIHMKSDAAAKREREERARREKQQRIDTFGLQNAKLVESALLAVTQVSASETARAGWLGDVDFSADIKGITDNFQKAHALRGVIDKLSALDKPSVEDRKILAEARTTVADLERTATERVELIGRCATEAQLIDKSLCSEREDARVAEQRAELHAVNRQHSAQATRKRMPECSHRKTGTPQRSTRAGRLIRD